MNNRITDFLPNRNSTETKPQYRNYSVVNTRWLWQITTNSVSINKFVKVWIGSHPIIMLKNCQICSFGFGISFSQIFRFLSFARNNWPIKKTQIFLWLDQINCPIQWYLRAHCGLPELKFQEFIINYEYTLKQLIEAWFK